MKSLLKPFSIAFATLLLFFVASRIVVGDECQQLYGGYVGGLCPRGEILIDKLVWNPTGSKGGTGVFVDNLGTNDHKFTATQEIIFKVIVKNVSNVLLDKIDVVDTLPVELEYVSGPDGASFNKDTREIRWEVKDLEANASRDFEIKAKVVTADRLPQDRSLTCVVNAAEASIPENADGDTSQVCIEKPIVGELPDTGPAEWMLVIGGSGVFGIAGLTLIKRSRASLIDA